MSPLLDGAALRAACAAYPKPADFRPSYGTAGFRAEASLLPSTVFRCGLLIGLRAKAAGQVGEGPLSPWAHWLLPALRIRTPCCNPPPWCQPHCARQACGVMITASHNPEADNGVKLVEPSGEMLAPDWEVHATQLAQAASDEELVTLVTALAAASTATTAAGTEHHQQHAMNGLGSTPDEAPPAPAASSGGTATGGRPKVVVGRDTRPSGEGLAAACRAGVQAAGAQVLDVGVVTTPELHFCVQTYNQYHPIEEAAYFTNLLESYRSLASGTPPAHQPLHVDCANGVGALKLQQMVPQLQRLGLDLVLHNTGEGRLNHLCGADYVQKEQTYPSGGW